MLQVDASSLEQPPRMKQVRVAKYHFDRYK